MRLGPETLQYYGLVLVMGGERGGRGEVVPSEVAKSVAWECGVEKGLNAVDGDGEGWLSENVVLVMIRDGFV